MNRARVFPGGAARRAKAPRAGRRDSSRGLGCLLTVAMLGLSGCAAAAPAALPAAPGASTGEATILGRDWVFTWVEGYDGELPGPPPLPGFILTAEGGRMTGVTGCNRMASGYALDEAAGTLGFRLLTNTRMMCNRADAETEQAVLTALIATDAFRLDGNTLELLSKGRPVARLTSP